MRRIVFQMKDKKIGRFDQAMQVAMAAELRSRIYRENRNQTWLQGRADLSQSAWRYYFGSKGTLPERNIPMDVVRRLAEAAGMTAGELTSIAERNAPEYIASTFDGIDGAEADDLQVGMDRTRRTRTLPPGMERNAGRSAVGE